MAKKIRILYAKTLAKLLSRRRSFLRLKSSLYAALHLVLANPRHSLAIIFIYVRAQLYRIRRRRVKTIGRDVCRRSLSSSSQTDGNFNHFSLSLSLSRDLSLTSRSTQPRLFYPFVSCNLFFRYQLKHTNRSRDHAFCHPRNQGFARMIRITREPIDSIIS